MSCFSETSEQVARTICRSLTVLGLLISLALVFWRWPDAAPDPVPVDGPGPDVLPTAGHLSSDAEPPALLFTDITRSAGLDFVHVNGAAGDKLLPETMAGGGAFLDFDNDGDADIFCVNSTYWPDDVRHRSVPTAGLFENDGRGHFRNITAGSGLDAPGIYGMGVACGDYDGDGRVDIYLTAVGANHLYRNLGDGRFEDVTAAASVAGDPHEWSSSAGWFDADQDGDLDLFVCNYLTWSADVDRSMEFTLTGSDRAYGRPTDFPGSHPRLFRNDGQGRFTDVSEPLGIRLSHPVTSQPLSKSLGVTFVDVNDDGRLDVLVANDTTPNQLFLNLSNDSWEEIGSVSGFAFDNDGETRGAMGIDAAVFRGADSLGVAIGNFANEMTALYVRQIRDPRIPLFRDEAVANGLGPVTRSVLTFGTLFVDVDLDGRPDLVTANGHLEQDIHLTQSSQTWDQSPQLLWNAGSHQQPEFVLLSQEHTGPDFVRPMVGRGLTCADIDGDGDQDLLVLSTGQAPRLLRNDQQSGHHWLQVKLQGQPGNSGGIGALVLLIRDDGVVLQQTVMPACSYQSQVEPLLTFGLGNSGAIKMLKVIWPSGQEQNVSVPQVNCRIEVQQTNCP